MTTDTLSQHAIQDHMNRTQAEQTEQYTLWQILGIVALVTLPMGLLAWVVAPALIPYSPLHPGITYWLLMIAGMAWQFVVSLVIVYRELGALRWSAIRQRTWLQPRVIQRRTSPIPGFTGGFCLSCFSMPWRVLCLPTFWMRPGPGCFLLCSPLRS
jgi:hypothetical protein